MKAPLAILNRPRVIPIGDYMPSSATSPEKFYGFKPGEDRKLARWDKIVKYFQRLDGESDRIKVVNLGETTEGNPFILAYISSKARARATS